MIDGDMGRFLIRLKEGEYEPARPHHLQQTVDRLFQQRRAEELQRIPNQRGIEALVGETEGLVKETLAVGRDLLRLQVVAFAEALLDRGQNVVRRQPMTEIGYEADIGLAGASQVED